MIVSNSTVLIFLSKLNKLELLKKLFKIVIIPEGVRKEAVEKGNEKGYIDARKIENAIKDQWIKVEPVKIEAIIENLNIDKGESEAISLAYQRKLKLLIDQAHAREAAKLLKINPRGTIYVLFLALSRRYIKYDEYLDCLEQLVEHGFRMSEEVYIEAVKMGKVFRKK